MERVTTRKERARNPGRPRVVPEELESVVIDLYRQGYGYRSIARILRNECGINPHFSSVRKVLIRLGESRSNSRAIH